MSNNEAHCPNIEGCALYPLLTLESSLRIWQTMFCRGRFERCARFEKSKAGQTVPAHLLPDGNHLRAP